MEENDELSGMCFWRLEVFIAVISCLSTQRFAKVLKELFFSKSKDWIALKSPPTEEGERLHAKPETDGFQPCQS